MGKIVVKFSDHHSAFRAGN